MFRYFYTICLLVILICACSATKKDDVQDIEQVEIQNLLQKYQTSWNEHDVIKYMELWHKDAKIMTGMRRIVSKEEYKTILPKRFRDYPTIKIIGKPDIIISGNKATVNLYSTYPPIVTEKFDEIFIFLKENGRWSIIENKY